MISNKLNRCPNKKTSSTTVYDHRAILARPLDLMTYAELRHGHHAAPERLSWQAREMREVRR